MKETYTRGGVPLHATCHTLFIIIKNYCCLSITFYSTLRFAAITFTNDVQQKAERAIKVMVSFTFAGGLEPLGLEELRDKLQFPCLSVTRELELELMLLADIPAQGVLPPKQQKEPSLFYGCFYFDMKRTCRLQRHHHI